MPLYDQLLAHAASVDFEEGQRATVAVLPDAIDDWSIDRQQTHQAIAGGDGAAAGAFPIGVEFGRTDAGNADLLALPPDRVAIMDAVMSPGRRRWADSDRRARKSGKKQHGKSDEGKRLPNQADASRSVIVAPA